MNQKEFLETVLPFKDKVYRLAKRLLVSSDEAEDATQELYFKLWKNKGKIEKYDNVEAYAMMMTKNYCLDQLKSKRASTDSCTSATCPGPARSGIPPKWCRSTG